MPAELNDKRARLRRGKASDYSRQRAHLTESMNIVEMFDDYHEAAGLRHFYRGHASYRPYSGAQRTAGGERMRPVTGIQPPAHSGFWTN